MGAFARTTYFTIPVGEETGDDVNAWLRTAIFGLSTAAAVELGRLQDHYTLPARREGLRPLYILCHSRHRNHLHFDSCSRTSIDGSLAGGIENARGTHGSQLLSMTPGIMVCQRAG